MKLEHRNLSTFREIWLVDFEYHQPPGERPTPICMVATELWSKETVRLVPPFPTLPPFNQDSGDLFVSYFAPAELSCYLALGWPFPVNILDLYAEFRLLHSGLIAPNGHGLLGALACFGIPGIESVEKASMRELAMRGGPFTDSEIAGLLDYCATDVNALIRLLPAMAPDLDFPRCLIRGEYMKAVADIECRGIPIDAPYLELLLRDWENVQLQVVQEIDADYGVFDGLTFKAERWERFLVSQQIPWPRLPSGTLALDDDTFKTMAVAYPIIEPMRQVRRSLSQLRLKEFAFGKDGRHRYMLSPFGSKTGRNQPSTSRFIFGGPAWVRNLILPPAGNRFVYIDYAQQEFGIAAALSGDGNMLTAYSSGDPYLQFAIMAGAVPVGATKQSHSAQRELFKACALGVQYGMQAESLAIRINQSPAHARELLRLHRETFPKYWGWSDNIQDVAMLRGRLTATFGWQVNVGPNANPRSLRNFPLQANGAEMLRLACIFGRERGVQISAPVHDALLIEAGDGNFDEMNAAGQQAMEDASAVVLDGFRLRTDVKIIDQDKRFDDPRGRQMWDIICRIIPPNQEVAT